MSAEPKLYYLERNGQMSDGRGVRKLLLLAEVGEPIALPAEGLTVEFIKSLPSSQKVLDASAEKGVKDV